MTNKFSEAANRAFDKSIEDCDEDEKQELRELRDWFFDTYGYDHAEKYLATDDCTEFVADVEPFEFIDQ